jgi:hypothetical protein
MIANGGRTLRSDVWIKPPAFLLAARRSTSRSNRPRHVIFLDQLLDIHRPPQHLLPVDPAD